MRGAEKTKENRSEELNGIKDQMMRLEQKQKIFSMCDFIRECLGSKKICKTCNPYSISPEQNEKD